MAAKEKKGSKRKATNIEEKPVKQPEVEKEDGSDYESEKVGCFLFFDCMSTLNLFSPQNFRKIY